MATQREADLSPELVAIAIEAFNREGGKRAASPFLWTIAEPQMKAALSAARPLIAREVLEDMAKFAGKYGWSRFLGQLKVYATERNIDLSQEGK